MLHKHPSAEKAQVYFEITEKIKHDAAIFFIHIQPVLGNIYDNSAHRALDEQFNFEDVRDRHLAHLSTLLTGALDHSFIEESHAIYNIYSSNDITPGEYIKLYQLIISYLSGEAHKKHWWRYKKYRDLNRAIRNLLLFDLAVGTSPQKLPASLRDYNYTLLSSNPQLSLDSYKDLEESLEELSTFANTSYKILEQCYNILQSILVTTAPTHANNFDKITLIGVEQSQNDNKPLQTSLFTEELQPEAIKEACNQNNPAILELLSKTHSKVKQLSKSLMNDHTQTNQPMKEMINDVLSNVELLSENLELFHKNQEGIHENAWAKQDHQRELYYVLSASSKEIGSHLDSLKDIQKKALYTK